MEAKVLFTTALQLGPEWRVVECQLDQPTRPLTLRLDFKAGSRFPRLAPATSCSARCTTPWRNAGGICNNTTTGGTIEHPVTVQRWNAAISAYVDLTDIMQIAAGPAHSVALDSSGTVWTWGYNQDGNLGHHGTTSTGYADQVAFPTGTPRIVAIGTGGQEIVTTNPDGSTTTTINSQTFALDASGVLWGWGYNLHGEIGNGGTTSQSSPQAVASSFARMTNQPPTVGLTLNTIIGSEPASFQLVATPADPDGDLAKVDFFQNGALLGSRTASPWSVTTSGLLAGPYDFSVRAMDAAGASASATVAEINVPLPSVQLYPSVTSTLEGSATPAKILVQRSNNVGDLVVNYEVAGSSTATSGLDYTALSGTLTIPAGTTQAYLSISALADMLVEGTETVTVQLTNGRYNATGGAQTVTITDDPPTVSVASTGDLSELGASGHAGQFHFTRTGPLQRLTLSYTVSGTATAGDDYTALAGTVTFDPGVSAVDVAVAPLTDDLVEGDETVIATIDSSANYATAPAAGSATMTIHDVPTVTLTAGTPDATEPLASDRSGTPGSFTLTRQGDTSADLTVNLVIDAASTATAGVDYTALGATATIYAGNASANIAVNPLFDSVYDEGETVIAHLGAGGLIYRIGASDTATVIIHDRAPTVTIQANQPNAAEEGATPGQYTLTRIGGDPTAPLTVLLTASGTATSGSDYQALPASVTFAADAATATVDLLPIDDTEIEPAESVVLTIAADGHYGIGAASSATVIIADNDPKVSAPLLNPPGGAYARGVEVVVTCSTPGAELHYTVNGAEPTTADPTVASGANVAIAASTELKVKAFLTGMNPSPTAGGLYYIVGDVAAGDSHTLRLTPEGFVLATGANNSGQLGDGIEDGADSFGFVPVLKFDHTAMFVGPAGGGSWVGFGFAPPPSQVLAA